MFKLRYLLVIAASCVFIHCMDGDVISFAEREEMKNVLIDISLANAAIEGFPLSERDSMREEYYKQIFEIHDISREEYKLYVENLKDNPELLGQIYQGVLDSLKKMKEELDDKRNEDKGGES